MCHRQSRGPQDLNTSSSTAASLQTQVLDLFLAKLNVCNYVICLSTEHQKVHKNLFKNSHAFQEFGNFGFGEEGKTRVPKEKPLGVENQQQVQCRVRESNLGQIGGRQMLPPLHHLHKTKARNLSVFAG